MIVALYARVSTARQAEKDLSIPDQLRQMREWCKAKNHQIAIRSEEHTSELQSRQYLHSFPTRRSSDLCQGINGKTGGKGFVYSRPVKTDAGMVQGKESSNCH